MTAAPPFRPGLAVIPPKNRNATPTAAPPPRMVTGALENTMMPVIGGIMRMGQGVAGAADMASSSIITKAAGATPPPPPQPATTFRDIPRLVWQTLTENPATQQARALENAKRNLIPLVRPMQRVQNFARAEYDFAKTEGDKIESSLPAAGKVVMKAVEQVPLLMLSGPQKARVLGNAIYGAGSEMGKAKSASASLPSLAATALLPGNTKLVNAVQPIVEETLSKLFPK